MQLSIVVPIYNVENYLRECLDSLYSLKIKETEIILVDDGSKDGSYNIIMEYKEKYSQKTVVVKKENGGLSSARNAGLKVARGEYVAFIDSDDFIDGNIFENFFKETKEKQLDIGVGDFRYYRDGKSSEPIFRSQEVQSSGILKGTEFMKLTLEKPKCFREEVVDDIYRREFLIEKNLYFQENLLHEDSYFTPRAYLKAEKVKYIPGAFYYYRQRSGSIMSEVSQKSIDSLEFICENLSELYEETDNFGKRALAILIPSFYRVIIYRYMAQNKDYSEKIKNYRKLYRKLKAYKNSVPEDLLLYISPWVAKEIRKILGKDIDMEQKTPEF
ncbi:MAG: glycosyltransferase [Cetobacterium sp.]